MRSPTLKKVSASALLFNLRSALETDRAGLHWIAPARSALVCAAAVALAVAFGEASHTTPLALGALFAGLSDPRGTVGVRSRALVITTLMNSIAAALGALVADSYVLHLTAAFLVSIFCGYMGVIGPRAATAGVLALVTFIVFSGTVYGPPDALTVALLMAAGALFQAIVSLLPVLTRRLGATRTEIAITYRSVALTFRQGAGLIGSSSLAAKIALARQLITESRASGKTREWLDELVETCERVRIGTFVLYRLEGDLDEAGRLFLKTFGEAASGLARAIGTALEIPPLRSRLGGRVRTLEGLEREMPPMPEAAGTATRRVLSELRHASELVSNRPWPIGRHGESRLTLSTPHEDVSRLWQPNETSPLFFRHAVRLAAVITLTTALTQVNGFEHSYWLPMTVAWVMKPDLAGSATRLTARLLGTLVGAFLLVAVIELTGSGPVAVTAIVGVSALLVFAFATPNYAVCTAGATAFILTLVIFAGNPVISSSLSRVALTVLAGVLVVLAAMVIPTRSLGLALKRLSSAADELADYIDAVRTGVSGEGLVKRRARAALESVDAGDVIAAVNREPGADREVTGAAERALFHLEVAGSFAAARELTPDPRDEEPLTEDGVTAIRSLASQVEAATERGSTPAPSPQGFTPELANPFEAEVALAFEAFRPLRREGGISPAT